MAEEETQQTQETQETPVPIVNADGTFSEKWRQSLPEEIRDDPSLDVCKTFEGTMSQFVHAQKSIGKNKVVVPTDKSTDIEHDQFREAIGVPKTSDEYEYAPDESIPKELHNEERIGRAKAIAHEIGMTPKQWERWVKFDNDEAKLILDTKKDTDVNETAKAEEVLKDKWGMAYEERVHVVNRLINETTVEGEDREAFIKEFGRNTRFIEWSAEVGKRLIEHKAIVAELTQETPKEAQAKIAEIEAEPGFMDGQLKSSNPAKFARLLTERAALYSQANPPLKEAG